MVEVKEFAGLRPIHPEKFCTKPYDVISKEEAEELRKEKENAIHIILPKGEGEEKYENARRAFEESRKRMLQDEPSIYFYEEKGREFSQRGFIFTVSLIDYEKGRIKKHEETREEPLKDRIKHIEATKAHTGLVWTLFKSNKKIKNIMDEIMKREPILSFPKYGYIHTLWKISDKETIEAIKSSFLPINLYIADGHHRMRAAYEYMKRYNSMEARYVMVFAASDDEVRILPYNRVIRKIKNENLLEELKKDFLVNELKKLKEPQKHEIQMYFKGKWWELIPKEIPEGVVDALDVNILQKKILEPILGIKDIRKDPNIFFIGGKMERKEYEKFIEEGNDAVFYLHPTSVEELERVADEQKNMPPKSTWFDPKVLTGMVFHEI
ncbi:MAG: DUF1015 domain-containing protein [Thermoplasmata archaeon]|nr:MAG: DUF1015 domain-containing protein [Thermoplasmata archaeon]